MVAQALWHLELAGGAEVPMLVRNDFVITNASLTDEVADVNARSVVKVAFEPKNPAELNGDDDEEDMSDDDEDEDDLEGLTPEDLESDDEDDEAVKEFKQEMRAKIAAAVDGDKTTKTKSNEVSASAIATEEDDDDEDEDDEDDEDFSLSEEPVDIALCALTPGKIEQVQLNLVFNEEDVVVFKNTGKNTIHLLGNYIDQYPLPTGERDDYDDLSDSEYDSEGYPLGDSDEEDSELDLMEGEEDSDVDMADLEKVVGRKNGVKGDSGRFEEINEAPKKKETKKIATNPAVATPETKKRKAEEPASAEKPGKKAEKKQKVEAAATPAVAAAEKKDNKKAAVATEKKKDEKPEQQGSKKKTLANGLVIEDVKIGDGAIAKKGKRCGMRYIGKLLNGKQFDANTAGSPFNFRLGAGEVIKGWDQGVAGMAVGGERKLTIPAALAYGSQKIPGIPPNSTLSFDIKLVNVK